jgi:hypothetical protein
MNTIRNLKLAAYAALVVAVIVDIWFEQHARALPTIKVDMFSLWIAAPFALMGMAIAVGNSVLSLRVLLALSILLALSSVFFYYDTLFVHVDAQGALIFLFLPLCQLVAVAIVLLGVIIARIRTRSVTANDWASDTSKTSGPLS